jgi:hypothetical protein
MVSIPSLWLPILLSAVFVFFVSWIIHMFLPYHRSDFRGLPSEGEVLETLRRLNIPPGEYMAPHGGGPEAMKNPEFIEKMKKGPLVIMTVSPGSAPNMGPYLAQWFLYCLLVGVFAAYITGRALAPGAHYLQAFRFAGATAFIGYALALWHDSIWYRRPWSTTLKSTFDGLIYGLLTGGTFGWLWPN